MKDLCKRCTICCHYKTVKDDGSILYSDRPCEYLDLDTGLCIVYEFREAAKEDCVRITKKVATIGALPINCPYVKGIKNYKGPRLTKRLEKIARAVLNPKPGKGRKAKEKEPK